MPHCTALYCTYSYFSKAQPELTYDYDYDYNSVLPRLELHMYTSCCSAYPYACIYNTYSNLR